MHRTLLLEKDLSSDVLHEGPLLQTSFVHFIIFCRGQISIYTRHKAEVK